MQQSRLLFSHWRFTQPQSPYPVVPISIVAEGRRFCEKVAESDAFCELTVGITRFTLAIHTNCNYRAETKSMTKNRYKWAATGDINAFFGLMLDNLAGLVLTVSLLSTIFNFPAKFAFQYMIPGTAIGVMVGDLLFFLLAFLHAKKTGNDKVTAMPLGLDTPSTIGMCLFVLGPAFSSMRSGLTLQAAGLEHLSENQTIQNVIEKLSAEQIANIDFAAASHAWKIGICAIFISGLIKLICAFGSGWIRKMVPRAGLLGSLAAIAVVLIAFNPLIEICHVPIVGLVSLVMVLMTLIARIRLPFGIPGALGAVIVSCAVYYIVMGVDKATGTNFIPIETLPFEAKDALLPSGWMTAFSFQWFTSETFQTTAQYLPLIIPFAIGTVIGGIDCAESAASVGDDFNTGTVIGVESIATIAASLCGGVIQTTPYIGHPAYKAMGGRALYTLLTALFVGVAGLTGFFIFFYIFVPKVAIYSILIFIGLEITAQSFQVTPKRHYAALALACLPALAKLVMINQPQSPSTDTLQQLAGGFIITSLLWASALAYIIDRKLIAAAWFFFAAGICTLFGIIHSPLPGDQMFIITSEVLDDATRETVVSFAAGYFIVASMLFGFKLFSGDKLKEINSDLEFDTIH